MPELPFSVRGPVNFVRFVEYDIVVGGRGVYCRAPTETGIEDFQLLNRESLFRVADCAEPFLRIASPSDRFARGAQRNGE